MMKVVCNSIENSVRKWRHCLYLLVRTVVYRHITILAFTSNHCDVFHSMTYLRHLMYAMYYEPLTLITDKLSEYRDLSRWFDKMDFMDLFLFTVLFVCLSAGRCIN